METGGAAEPRLRCKMSFKISRVVRIAGPAHLETPPLLQLQAQRNVIPRKIKCGGRGWRSRSEGDRGGGGSLQLAKAWQRRCTMR